MAVPNRLSKITGSWAGVTRLWLTPDENVQESETHAVIGLVAQGKFINLQYTWAYEGQPQEGLLIVGRQQKESDISVFWIDSFHMDDAYMILKGTSTENGGISVLGSYSVAESPEWGWRIIVDPQENGKFLLKMFNISPEGQEYRAVEAEYSRNV
ncbi:MAG: DUF1579 domain-containing protein [Chloroflexi bacterium]|nr:MAG: DUF1579 domain-containing protein [Chloroflexota bacterium]